MGPKGEPGYTPIKGVDYFDGEPGPAGPQGDPYVLTQEDINTIADAVLAGFPVAEEVEW